MCGIIGVTRRSTFSAASLLDRLRRLEYRGYDSFGYASSAGLRREIGRIVVEDADKSVLMSEGIAHTRWATHGGVTTENAHPHRVGRVTLVHNGIIENADALGGSRTFLSQTDSERLATAIDDELREHPPHEAILAALARANGTWAIAALIGGEEGVFVSRHKAPLLIGKLYDGYAIASDIRGLVDATRIHALDDGAVAVVHHDSVRIHHKGAWQEPAWEENIVENEESPTEGYAMEREIRQTPAMLTQLALSSDTVVHVRGQATIIGCGSSYNASLLARGITGRDDIDVRLASDERTLRQGTVIAVSQSGETADVLDAVERATEQGCDNIVALVNTPHSTLTRVATSTILLRAGEERCVAATKSFTLQTALLAKIIGDGNIEEAAVGASDAIAQWSSITKMAHGLASAEHVFVIGRGPHYALACELALKLKEVAYLHAEAVPALELKHGPLALVTPGTPIIALGSTTDVRLVNTMHEVSARGGALIPLFLGESVRDIFRAAVASQILAFEVAKLRGTPVDMPRNLAKSVTVR